MDPARDPKTYASRLELDYFQRPRSMRRWKWTFSLFAFVVVTVAAVGMVVSPQWHTAFQAAPVSSAHAVFGANCAACHDQHFTGVRRLVPGDHIGSVSDAKCLACHTVGRHDPHQLLNTGPDNQAANCTSCHQEHRGRVLSRLSDATCVACHANLQTDDGHHRYATEIRHFADGHPQFGAWRGHALADPAGGKFFFNHERHLNLTKELKDLDQTKRPQLKAELDKLRTMDCNYCHRTEPDGARMEAISYNSHCAACHPLSVAAQPAGAWPDDVAVAFAKELLPHPAAGEKPDKIRGVLLERYLRLGDKTRAAREAATVEPPVLRTPEDVAALADRERLALERTRLTEPQLFSREGMGCALCHKEESRTDGLPTYAYPYQLRGRWRDVVKTWPDPRFHPPHANQTRAPLLDDASNRWYPLAKFDHLRHRTMACSECHPAATSSKTADVLIPGYDTCVKCHNTKVPSARSDCLACHRYHDRSQEKSPPAATPKPLADMLK